ncbi:MULTISPECIES: four-carbon acid sugar kinase family protein [unclassified Vreelandella]
MAGQVSSAQPHEIRLAILADDLSGAADCAVSYARRNLPTSIELAQTDRPQSQVLVVDTDSRHLPSAQAASVCLEAWRRVAAPQLKLYKKIDSTLRGNWVEEVAALIPDVGMAIVAPAMPAMQRVTRDGRQYIDQTPVEKSEVWRNEQRAGKADIVWMLAQQKIKTAHLTLAALRDCSLNVLIDWLVAQQENGVEALVCDAQTSGDLDRIAQASQSLERVFWVGSAGLSQALSAYVTSEAPVTVPVRVNGPVLTVVGSMSPISHRQIDHLAEQANGALAVFRVDIHALLNSPTPPEAILMAQMALGRGEDVLVTLAQQTPDPSINGYALSSRLAHYLGPQLDGLGGLVATGGETAKALLSAAGIDRLRLVDELEPGVVLSLGPSGLPVVTKAGGFGETSSLYQAWRYLVQQRDGDSFVDESRTLD